MKAVSALDAIVSQAEFAKMVGLSEAKVSRLAADGVLSRGGTAHGWLLAYCERLREVAGWVTLMAPRHRGKRRGKEAFPGACPPPQGLTRVPRTTHNRANPARGRCLKTPFDKRCNLPDSEVLSRLNSGAVAQLPAARFGRDGQAGNTWRTSYCVFSTSRPPALLENRASGFKSQ